MDETFCEEYNWDCFKCPIAIDECPYWWIHGNGHQESNQIESPHRINLLDTAEVRNEQTGDPVVRKGEDGLRIQE